MDGGSIGDLIARGGALGDDEVLGLLHEICCGLAYLHADERVHRDIKPTNVLISHAGHVKLADFGAAGALSAAGSIRHYCTMVGTPLYMAPEVILHADYDSKVSPAARGPAGVDTGETAQRTTR